MNRKPLINIPKQKKQPKPIAKIGKRGLKDKKSRKASLDKYFELHGWDGIAREDDGQWVSQPKGECQLCGFSIRRSDADFSHKQRASQRGSNAPENGLALHRLCHSYLHTRRDLEDICTKSPANMLNGMKVELPDQLKMDLLRFLGLLA